MNNIVKITDARKKSKNHTWFLGLILVIAIVCFLLLSPIFAIQDIEVRGNSIVSSKYIVSASGIFFGENILKMNKFNAIDKINSVPAIESAKIKREWPNKIVITIEEKDAIAETSFYGSKLVICDDGDVISVITDSTATNLPFLDGIVVQDVIVGAKLLCSDGQKLEKYLEVLKILKENDMLNDIVKLSYKDGILIHFALGHIAFLGETDNLQYKISWLKGILEKEANPAYIDLHNLEKVITKPAWGIFEESV